MLFCIDGAPSCRGVAFSVGCVFLYLCVLFHSFSIKAVVSIKKKNKIKLDLSTMYIRGVERALLMCLVYC